VESAVADEPRVVTGVEGAALAGVAMRVRRDDIGVCLARATTVPPANQPWETCSRPGDRP
jgi:hypothetical protein